MTISFFWGILTSYRTQISSDELYLGRRSTGYCASFSSSFVTSPTNFETGRTSTNCNFTSNRKSHLLSINYYYSYSQSGNEWCTEAGSQRLASLTTVLVRKPLPSSAPVSSPPTSSSSSTSTSGPTRRLPSAPTARRTVSRRHSR